MSKIGRIIEQICKEQGIDYKSPYKNNLTSDDIESLVKIYYGLKEIIATLCEIEERHRDLKQVSNHLHKVIKILDKLDHSLFQDMKVLKGVK